MARPTVLATLLCACGGSGEPASTLPPAAPAATGQAETLALSLTEATSAEAVIDLAYGRKAGQPGPRMMELYLSVSGLELVASEPLDAARAAQKEVIVQTKAPGVLRTVVMATTNLTELESGPLVRYRFKRLGGSEQVDFVPEDPIFAPPEANTGLTLGQALVVGGP